MPLASSRLSAALPWLFLLAGLGCHASALAAEPRMLSGELTAEQVLNGIYEFPASPPADVTYNDTGLDRARLGKTPPPGVHPRILLSPDELPELRQRLNHPAAGQAMLAAPRERVPVSWEYTSGRLDFRIEVPPGVNATVHLPTTGKTSAFELDGAACVGEATGRYLPLELKSGMHVGSITLLPAAPHNSLANPGAR